MLHCIEPLEGPVQMSRKRCQSSTFRIFVELFDVLKRTIQVSQSLISDIHNVIEVFAGMLFIIIIALLQIRSTAATCSPGRLSDSMYNSDILRGGQAIVSSDGLKMLLMGTDGSLKLIYQQTTYWSVVIPNPNNRYLIMQPDGNLVMYDSCGESTCAVWSTGTDKGQSSYHLFLQSDKNLILEDASGNILWASQTYDASMALGSVGVCVPCSSGAYSSAFGDLCMNCEAGTFSGKH